MEVLEFFHGLGVLILEGYGLTECTTATVNMPGSFRFGTVGKPLPGCTVGRGDDGEILLAGEGVCGGYHHRPDDTEDAFDADGWFRTGDIGELDRDGFLRITDRKKDLIATSAGKKVAPQHLEGLLSSSPLISQALIIGDLRPYITALVTLDPERLAAWAASAGIDPLSPKVIDLPELRELVGAAVDGTNRELARPEQIKRFAIVPREFSIEHGEVTPTLAEAAGLRAAFRNGDRGPLRRCARDGVTSHDSATSRSAISGAGSVPAAGIGSDRTAVARRCQGAVNGVRSSAPTAEGS